MKAENNQSLTFNNFLHAGVIKNTVLIHCLLPWKDHQLVTGHKNNCRSVIPYIFTNNGHQSANPRTLFLILRPFCPNTNWQKDLLAKPLQNAFTLWFWSTDLPFSPPYNTTHSSKQISNPALHRNFNCFHNFYYLPKKYLVWQIWNISYNKIWPYIWICTTYNLCNS